MEYHYIPEDTNMLIDQLRDEKIAALSHIFSEEQRSGLNQYLKSHLPEDHLFALKIADGDFFPIDTPVNTVLSWTYFRKAAGMIDADTYRTAGEKIASSAKMFNIDLREITDSMESKPEKTADDAQYLLAKGGKNYYPVRSEEDVKTAMDYFEQNLTRFEPIDRRTFARNLNKVAGQMGVTPTLTVSKFSADGYATDTSINIKKRAGLVHDGEVKEAYDVLADEFQRLPPTAVMAVLHDLDKIAGISNLWDTRIPDPAGSVYGQPDVKTADVVAETSYGDLSGSDVKKAVDSGVLNDILDKDTLKMLKANPKKMAEEIPSPIMDAIAAKIRLT